jgi:hypothetical protein
MLSLRPAGLLAALVAQTSFWTDNEHFAAHAQQLEGELFIQATTPLPDAFPLFATGLGALGLISSALLVYPFGAASARPRSSM